MPAFLRKHYRAIIFGCLITLGLYAVAILTGLVFLNQADISAWLYRSITAVSLLASWLVVAYSIHKFSLKKTLITLCPLLVAIMADHYLEIRYNPITVPLIILFWLSVAQLIIPDFFKKYRGTIIVVYGSVIAYYLFSFATTEDASAIHRQKFANIWLSPIPIFGALWVYEQWRWLKNLQADKAKAELSLLKSQLNPHFFFNTLNNLYGLAVEKAAETPAMILKLSDVMRYTIYDGAADFVPLADEVNYLENYIELQKLRYHRKVDIRVQMDVQHQHKIAPLLLIIPLENAFKHGVERQAAEAYIALDIQTTPANVTFTIRNNYTPDPTHPPGIGLDNLKKRLALIYPDRHELKITEEPSTYTVNLKIEMDEVPHR